MISNIQQNLTCADLRYSPRLTIRYWCPAEWISNHILTDIPQIPSVICWSTKKYHLQEHVQWKFVSSNTARFSTNWKTTSNSSILHKKICVFKHCKIFELKNKHFVNSETHHFYNCSTSPNSYKLLQLSANILRKSKWTRNYSKFVELKEVLPNYHSNF